MADSCGNPAADVEALMPRRKKYDKSRICVKCKENPGKLIIRHAVYCKECFISLMTFKFRRSLEPFVNAKPDGPRRTALKPQGNLLIGLSGGAGSTVLLDLIHRYYVAPDKALVTEEGGSHHPRHEKVWQKVFVGYVEVCDAFPEMKERTNDIRSIVERYGGMIFVPLRIQDAFDPAWWKSIGRESVSLSVNIADEHLRILSLQDGRPPSEAMRSYMASLPTTTARSTALQTLTRILLQYSAVSNGCSHAVLGTSLTSLAVSLISGVAHGGGFHIKEEIQEEWVPDVEQNDDVVVVPKKRKISKHGLRIIRPLRDVGMKECGAWAWWMGLEVAGRETWKWPGAKPGIGTLTKAFIVGLEKDYPSTVSTIVRTCGKLTPKGTVAGLCVSCKRPIQQGIQDWRARISIRSRQGDASASASDDLDESLASFLCYTCQTTLTSRSSRPTTMPYLEFQHDPSATPMPVWTSRIARRHNMDNGTNDVEDFTVVRKFDPEEMRDAVSDFLLEE